MVKVNSNSPNDNLILGFKTIRNSITKIQKSVGVE